MSATPTNLPKRTRVLVKDLLFQEKYTLTDTQVDIMSYIFNAFTWAMQVDGYMVLTSKKILGDLPQIGDKTLDATFKIRDIKGRIATITNGSEKPMIYGYDAFEEFILKYRE